jgi:hypothetical protein
MKKISMVASMALMAFCFSGFSLAKGSTLVDGSGNPVKVAGGCAKVAKSGKTDFHYSVCHAIKPKPVK